MRIHIPKHPPRTRSRRDWLSGVALTACLALFISPFNVKAQSDPVVLVGWSALEEADFLVDVSYTVVQCDPDSEPLILLNVFNEGGQRTNFGITLELSDGSGNHEQLVIPPFDTPFAAMHIASCDSDEYGHLKLPLPAGMDTQSLSVEISYQ